MLYGAFVTVAALTLSPTPRPAQPSPASIHSRARQARIVVPLPADPNALYSVRARRRFAAYLRLRLLELRQEHLARAADAIERRISVKSLLDGP